MLDATATQARRFETGDIVYGRPIFEGKIQSRRKGIVLGPFEQGDTKRVVVWWYGLGAASTSTSTLMWNDELTPAGDIYELNARRATKLFDATATYPRAGVLHSYLRSHAVRMRRAGLL